MNPMEYWGIDYPPLSAMHSYLCALLLNLVDPAAVTLVHSRGYETQLSKAAIRLTTLLSDALTLLPAITSACATLPLNSQMPSQKEPQSRFLSFALASLFPAQVLIDHAHTQYNCVSLGLSLAAAVLVLRKRWLLASVLFTCAFNHKHMALYFAPAFFSHMLGHCFIKTKQMNSWFAGARELLLLATCVMGTTFVCWLPIILSGRVATMNALKRLLPVHRGVFEDYVANFWCISNVLAHWKVNFSRRTLECASAILTLLSVTPSCMVEILHAAKTSRRSFTRLLFICALGAFLFGYQVHEKNILYSGLAVTLLSVESPLLWTHFQLIAMFRYSSE